MEGSACQIDEIINIYDLPVKRLLRHNILQKYCIQNHIIWYGEGFLIGKSYMALISRI